MISAQTCTRPNIDNSIVVLFSKDDKCSKGEKHMDLKYLSTKEVHKHIVSIGHIHTNLMIADP